MRLEVAQQINAAACNVCLFGDGIITRLAKSDVALVHRASVAQIESATEVIEAENQAGRKKGVIVSVLAPTAIPRVKSIAAKIQGCQEG